MASASEIVVRSSADIAQLDELDRMLLTGERVEVVEDPAELSRQIVAQLLSAESDAELERSNDAIGWAELLGVPIELHGFRWRPSTFSEGAAVFFVVSGTRLDTGDPVVLTTGASNVLAQLSNMARRGTLVGAIRMLEKAEKPTAAGYYPLWLKTPGEIEPDSKKVKDA